VAHNLKAKPKKPYADFPLTWHPSGTWCKKIRGKLHYFGADANDALVKYQEQRDDLQAGRTPRTKTSSPTLRSIVNAFLTAKRALVDSNELTAYTFADCYRICECILSFFGKDSQVSDLRPEDFGRFRIELAKTKKSLVTLGNAIIRTRSFFNWALTNRHILAPVDFGTSFEIPGRKAKRKAKNQAKQRGQGRTFTADECRQMIEAARQPVKTMILLGLNCGFGQTDVANLPLNAVDLNKGWIDFPRVKTETDRRCPLWPETIESLREAICLRTEPQLQEDAHLVFLTTKGNRWIQKGQFKPETDKTGEMFFFNDNVAKEFAKLLVKLKLKRRGSFYNLRHCFRTEAANAQDREAIDVIMGHVDASMGGNYVDHVEDKRLTAVADVVYKWLFPVPEGASTVLSNHLG